MSDWMLCYSYKHSLHSSWSKPVLTTMYIKAGQNRTDSTYLYHWTA